MRRLLQFLSGRSKREAACGANSCSLRHAGLSHLGRTRGNNEDRWFADPAERLYLVSDGMGGQFAGELASRVVVEVLPAEVRKAVGDAETLADPATSDRVVQSVAELSRNLRRESEREPGLSGMGATLVLALVRNRQALVVHMGDSRAYLWRAGELRRLTRDHTLVQLLLEGGVLDQSQAATHPARNQLSRFVGMPSEPLPESQLVDLQPGDRLLLCTDGLTGMLDDEQLRVMLGAEADLERICQRLIEAANAAGGKDNVTALVLAM